MKLAENSNLQIHPFSNAQTVMTLTSTRWVDVRIKDLLITDDLKVAIIQCKRLCTALFSLKLKSNDFFNLDQITEATDNLIHDVALRLLLELNANSVKITLLQEHSFTISKL